MRVVREHRDDLVSRVRVLTAVVTGLLVVIATGFWFTQLVQGDYYRELAENNRLRKLPIKAPRGLIFDRKGRLLVENVPSYNLMIDRSRAADLDHSLWYAAGVLGRPVAELQQILHQLPRRAGVQAGAPRREPLPLRGGALRRRGARLPGVRGRGPAPAPLPPPRADRPHPRLPRRADAWTRSRRRTAPTSRATWSARRGSSRPTTPSCAARTASGWWSSTAAASCSRSTRAAPAVPGKNLTLSIDLDLQQEAARWLDGPEKVGAVVAMDPRNGEILALVSSPAYNPNLFARRLQQDDWQALIDDPNHPLQNRAIQNTYSPGSTFKIVMATAGLTEKIFDDHTTVCCSGSKAFYGRAVPLLEEGRARHGGRPLGAQALLRRLLLHPRPEDGDREDRPLLPPVRPRLAHRHRHPGGEAGASARPGVEPEGRASSPGTPARRSPSRSARGRCWSPRSRWPS